MFRAIRERLNWQSGKSRLAMAAAICAAGLAIGLGGSALLAQLTSPNPVPQTETTKYGPCVDLVPCADSTCPLGLCYPAPGSLTVQVPGTVPDPNGYASLGAGTCGACILGGAYCGQPPIAAACIGGVPEPLGGPN